jgi:hypothetical protein
MAERTTKMTESHGVVTMRGPSARLGPRGLDQGVACIGWCGVNAATWGQHRARGDRSRAGHGNRSGGCGAWEMVTRALWLSRWPIGWSG